MSPAPYPPVPLPPGVVGVPIGIRHPQPPEPKRPWRYKGRRRMTESRRWSIWRSR
jgi:hypothetical protein